MLRIWFNKHISSMSKIINDIKVYHPEVFILYTHTLEKMKPENADCFFIEQENYTKEEYLQFCIDMVKTYNINIFYPHRNFDIIYNNKEIFENLGVKLIFSVSPINFKIVDDKYLCYKFIEEKNLNVFLPKYSIFKTKLEFKKEYQILKNITNGNLCMKPTVSIFAAGFKIIHDELEYNQWKEMLNAKDIYDISYNILMKILPSKSKFKSMILMELLPGDEYSIDCICDNGVLITNVIRQKHMIEERDYQTLTYNESVLNQAKELIKEFNFSGFINMQFREDINGLPRFLEINPRVSGGIGKCNLSGINFSDIFIKNIKKIEINNKNNYNVKVSSVTQHIKKD